MKLMKKVLILSAIVVSVGSSVAFGCNANQVADTTVDQTKVAGDSGSAVVVPAGSQSNGGEVTPKK